MTQCTATATVEPGGAVVRCELDEGHDEDGTTLAGDWIDRTPHRYTLTWQSEGVHDLTHTVVDPAPAQWPKRVVCGAERIAFGVPHRCTRTPHPESSYHQTIDGGGEVVATWR